MSETLQYDAGFNTMDTLESLEFALERIYHSPELDDVANTPVEPGKGSDLEHIDDSYWEHLRIARQERDYEDRGRPADTYETALTIGDVWLDDELNRAADFGDLEAIKNIGAAAFTRLLSADRPIR